MQETNDSYTKRALDCIKNVASAVDEKYNGLYRVEQDALCSSIFMAGLLGTIYLATTDGSLTSFLPFCASSGIILYLDRKSIASDMQYNMLRAELGMNE